MLSIIAFFVRILTKLGIQWFTRNRTAEQIAKGDDAQVAVQSDVGSLATKTNEEIQHANDETAAAVASINADAGSLRSGSETVADAIRRANSDSQLRSP